MRNLSWLAGLTFAAAMVACNLSAPFPPTPTIAAASEVQSLPSRTPTPHLFPIELPTFTPTATPAVASARPKAELVNCRSGPGTIYSLTGELKEGQSARIAGQNEQGTWYYVQDPGNPDGYCWVSMEFVETTGNVKALPTILPPVPSVKEIAVSVDPARLLVACDQFPQFVALSADITTDGPALVTYRWEMSTGEVSAQRTIAFEESTTQKVGETYQAPGPNDYSVSLHVLGPNDISEKADFRVLCNP